MPHAASAQACGEAANLFRALRVHAPELALARLASANADLLLPVGIDDFPAFLGCFRRGLQQLLRDFRGLGALREFFGPAQMRGAGAV
jgi:hypothetical protein